MRHWGEAGLSTSQIPSNVDKRNKSELTPWKVGAVGVNAFHEPAVPLREQGMAA
jgi:hypothetical protein